jgi:tetratricopeptide (TPR) repeat protein
MTWEHYHSQSEQYASAAQIASRERDYQRAKQLYHLAAEQEELALSVLDQSKTRTMGITTVSAAALWYKAGEYDRAKDLALRSLQTGSLPPFAIHQLQELLSEIARIEKVLEAIEEWRVSAPISSSAREMLTKAVEEWRASAA